jgi:hypothetical protein
MNQKADQLSNGDGIQVFELTMDNPEDQDELNRRLRKPGVSDPGAPPKNGSASPSAPTEKEPGRTNG